MQSTILTMAFMNISIYLSQKVLCNGSAQCTKLKYTLQQAFTKIFSVNFFYLYDDDEGKRVYAPTRAPVRETG